MERFSPSRFLKSDGSQLTPTMRPTSSPIVFILTASLWRESVSVEQK